MSSFKKMVKGMSSKALEAELGRMERLRTELGISKDEITRLEEEKRWSRTPIGCLYYTGVMAGFVVIAPFYLTYEWIGERIRRWQMR